MSSSFHTAEDEAHSLMDFESGFDNANANTNANASLLSFDQNDHSMYNSDPPLMENFNCFDSNSRSQDAGRRLKRPHKGENVQAMKKQCTDTASTIAAKNPKAKTSVPDQQSIAAKNRRERVSERLKILQELVPNGSKVDMVTMLEKAIGYVKFLQLQVKVLATDEFWPFEGGKAPDISQVREVLDAILSSQREKNSSSM